MCPTHTRNSIWKLLIQKFAQIDLESSFEIESKTKLTKANEANMHVWCDLK